MKRTYVLKYRTGWGESCEINFEARTIIDAQEIAKNYCKQNLIMVARLISNSGKTYIV